MNSLNDKLALKKWNPNEIQKWLANKDYAYKNLILNTSDAIKKLWPELEKCCIINFDRLKNGSIDRFIEENEITVECLKNTLIIPWMNDSNWCPFELKTYKNINSEIKYISIKENFNLCCILSGLFIEKCCEYKDIYKIQEYYDHISSFKTKIEQRYYELKNELTSEIDVYQKEDNMSMVKFLNSSLNEINYDFINIDEYLRNLLSSIQNNINKKDAKNKDEKFDKTFNQNKFLGKCSIIFSSISAVALITTAVLSILTFLKS